MEETRVIAVGASAGGVEALSRLVSALPSDIDAAILVVLHLSPDLPSYLPRILERQGSLPASHAVDGAPVLRGHIHVAPPDRHLHVEDGELRVRQGSRENRHRPSIDVLLRSAAVEYGPRAIGVVLSGALDDGVAGMEAIVRCGGHALVQEPSDADHPFLPQNVLNAVPGVEAHPVEILVKRLQALVTQSTPANVPADAGVELGTLELRIGQHMGSAEDMSRLGDPSGLSCTECNGALTRVADTRQLRFRCHTGHAYTASSLYNEQNEQAERPLWQALRQMRETADTSRALIAHAHHAGAPVHAAQYQEQLRQAEQGIATLHRLVTVETGAEPG